MSQTSCYVPNVLLIHYIDKGVNASYFIVCYYPIRYHENTRDLETFTSNTDIKTDTYTQQTSLDRMWFNVQSDYNNNKACLCSAYLNEQLQIAAQGGHKKEQRIHTHIPTLIKIRRSLIET